jgi:hypothetical protein
MDEMFQKNIKSMALNGVPTSYIKGLNRIQAFVAGALIVQYITPDNIKAFTSFCDYNERSLIQENDVSKYKTFKQVKDAVKIVDEKLAENIKTTDL